MAIEMFHAGVPMAIVSRRSTTAVSSRLGPFELDRDPAAALTDYASSLLAVD